MIRFNSDYLEGAHPRIMQRLMETNLEQSPGYGEDAHCEHARSINLANAVSITAYECYRQGLTRH